MQKRGRKIGHSNLYIVYVETKVDDRYIFFHPVMEQCRDVSKSFFQSKYSFLFFFRECT